MKAAPKLVVVGFWLTLLAFVPASGHTQVTPTDFVNLTQPYGIATDPADNVYVTSDGTFTTHLKKFSPEGEELRGVTLGGPTSGELGRLARDPATGDIWDLSINGNLRIVDPETLDVQLIGDLSDLDVSATSNHVWDVLWGGYFDRSGSILPWYSTFGDIALWRSANNTRLDAFVTARNTGYNVPYVLRLTWEKNGENHDFKGAVALMTSTAIYPVNIPRGIAVTPSGTVVTTLPRIGRLGADFTEQIISFPVGFPETGRSPRVELDAWDESSRGIVSDTGGNVYLTSQINSSRCGVNAGASIMVLSPALQFRACHPHSLLGSGEDIAVTQSGDHVYSTISNQHKVVDWGRLVTSKNLTVLKSGNGAVTSTPTGIDCGPNCSASFGDGVQVTLRAQAVPGSSFNGWSGVPGCTGTGDCTVTMSTDRTVTATFSGVARQLNTAKSGSGNGAVTSTPNGIDCGDLCGASFEDGVLVTLHAQAAAGSAFTGWSGVAGCSSTGDCTVTMDADRSVTATFTGVIRQLSTGRTGSGNGTITSTPAAIECGSNCSASFANGFQVTLHAEAAPGSSFSGWSGGGCSGTGDCILTMNGDRLVTAAFSLNPAASASPTPPLAGGSGFASLSPASIEIRVRRGGTVRVSASGAFKLPGLEISCPSGGGRCSGQLSLSTASAVETSRARTAVRKKLALARTSLSIAPGQSLRPRIKLSRKGLRLLKRLKTVRATATITADNAASPAGRLKVAVKLRAPRRR